MRRGFFRSALASAVVALGVCGPSYAGPFGFGDATEFTQLLNNAELIALGGQNAKQIANQVKQISQLAEQIQNQLKIYENMLQNTRQLPDHIWGQAAEDLAKLQDVVGEGQGIAFSMANLDDVLKERFPSYSDFQSERLTGRQYSDAYQSWSNTNRETFGSTLAAAGLVADQFATEEDTLAKLRSQSQSAVGQMQALQVGHQIAAQQVTQIQKLRGLIAQHMTMLGTWYQSEQSLRDQAQAENERFFGVESGVIVGDETSFRPEW